MSSARLLISGYYGFDNFGDEAILRIFVDEWRRRRDDRLTVLSARPAETAARYGVEALPRGDWRVIRNAVRESDVLVSGGGGLLQTATSVRAAAYYAAIVSEAARAGRPAAIFAQGVGPLNYFGRQIVKRACAHVGHASVRDGASAALLRSLIPHLDVRLGADPVFLAPAQPSPDIDERLVREGIRSDGSALVCVVVRRSPLLERAVDELAAAVDRLENEHRAHVVFVPLQSPEDADASVAVIRRCRTSPVLLGGGYDLPAMTALFARCSAVLSMRLHALIVASRLAVPFLAIAHDPKIAALVEELSYPLEPLDRGGDAKGAVASLWQRRGALSDHLRRATPALAARAALTFDWLAEFVQGRMLAQEKQS